MSAGIFVTDHLAAEARDALTGHDIFELDADDASLRRCEVLMAWPSRVKRGLLERMAGLRMIQSLSAGVDALDFHSIPPGIRVFSNAGAYTDPVAEHAWGLALGVAKGLHAGQKRLPPRHLRSRTVLVLGCGAIGSEVARLARVSLGMRTLGVSRSFRSPELFDEMHSMDELGSVIGEADLIVNALPLTVATKGVIGYELLSRTKDNAILVNVGRGDTVDKESVIRWLKERPESRFATDVFWKTGGKEVFDPQLWGLPNFAGTMHTAASQDRGALANAHLVAARNVRLFLDTGNALNEVIRSDYVR